MRILLLLAALLIGTGCGTRGGWQRYEGSRVVMGTPARVVLYAKDEALARRAIDAAFARMEALDRVLSDYREDSEINRLVARGRGHHRVSLDLMWAVREAQRYGGSRDVFDVSIGHLTRLWRRAAETRVLPSQEAIDKARAKMSLVFGDCSSGVYLEHDGMRLDFGGIGKGLAADAALRVLYRMGTPRALVDVGGDLALGEPPPGESGWLVAVDGATTKVRLTGRGIAFSGDRERGFEIDGVHYSHALDPRTGWPMRDRRRVVVVGLTAAEADAFATTFRVIDPRDALKDVTGLTHVDVLIEWWEDGVRRLEASPEFPKDG